MGDVHSPVEAMRWQRLGYNRTRVQTLVKSGIDARALKRASTSLGLSVADAALLLVACRGDVDYAQQSLTVLGLPASDAALLLEACGGDLDYAEQSLPVLARVPDLPLITILSPRYSSAVTLQLLDRELSVSDFSLLGNAHVPEEQILGLLDSGLTALDLSRGHDAGYTPEALGILAQNHRSFVAATGEKLSLADAVRAGIDPDGLVADAGERFLNDQRSLRTTLVTEFGASLEQADSIGQEYLLAGIVSDRTSWFERGIAPKAARFFVDYDVVPQDAALWLAHGFTPSEAVTFVERGITPGHAADERRTLAWTEYFARSRRFGPNTFVVRREVDTSRVREALESLAVPHKLTSGMYSGITERWCLLDGDVFRDNNYGYIFSGPSGIWVTGTTTMRFLCHRLGLDQSQRLRGELTIPDQGELERMFQDDRRRNWPNLSKRLEPAPRLAGPE
jgi:hypothetical protein